MALAPTAAGAASPSLYVGDAKEYAVAFKAEEAGVYVIEIAGSAHCYFNEPHEDLGFSGFSVFAAPTPMTQAPKALVAEDIFSSSEYGGTNTEVRANLGADGVSGIFNYEESEESFHCDSGRVDFAARPYAPVGTPGTLAPVARETRVYYDDEAPIETFMRPKGGRVGGIRGSFVPQCPVGRLRGIPVRAPLFARPVTVKRGEHGGFRHQVEYEGGIGTGTIFKEKVSLTGQLEGEALSGSYSRVRTSRPKTGPEQRCVTGPLPFRAVRYLPLG